MEILDIYDSNGNPTGRTHQRYTPLGPGEFCLAAAVIIYNSAGEILCTLRSPDKKLAPNQWESPGGSVLAGETSREGAVRELWEETGIPASADELRLLGRSKLRDVFLDVYALHKDFPLNQIRLQPGETAKARWFTIEQWEGMARDGKMLALAYTADTFAAVRKLVAPGSRTAEGREA